MTALNPFRVQREKQTRPNRTKNFLSLFPHLIKLMLFPFIIKIKFISTAFYKVKQI